MQFSDSRAYAGLIGSTHYFLPQNWWVFEPFSKVLFLVLMDLTQDLERSVAGGHFFISVVCLLGFLAIFPPRQGNWRGLLMAFALFGPQLAFVTIRATPAYILAAIAVLEAARGRHRSFAWLVGAGLFHVSSALALVPIMALLFRSYFGALQRLRDPRILLSVLFFLGLMLALASPIIFSSAQVVLESIPFLSKYTVFLVGLSDEGGISTIQTFAFGHFVLLAGITVFFFFYIVINDPITRKSSIFVVVGFLVYALMFFAFSPIAAFRQTLFWMLPALSLFPWHRVGWSGPGQIPFLALVLGIFAFQFDRVLV